MRYGPVKITTLIESFFHYIINFTLWSPIILNWKRLWLEYIDAYISFIDFWTMILYSNKISSALKMKRGQIKRKRRESSHQNKWINAISSLDGRNGNLLCSAFIQRMFKCVCVCVHTLCHDKTNWIAVFEPVLKHHTRINQMVGKCSKMQTVFFSSSKI